MSNVMPWNEFRALRFPNKPGETAQGADDVVAVDTETGPSSTERMSYDEAIKIVSEAGDDLLNKLIFVLASIAGSAPDQKVSITTDVYKCLIDKGMKAPKTIINNFEQGRNVIRIDKSTLDQLINSLST